MKTSIVALDELQSSGRLDSTFYLSSGNIASRKVTLAINCGADFFTLGDQEIANIWQPGRNVLCYSSEDEPSVPYLQPYDILEYLPSERSRLSIARSEVDGLRIHAGTILQTCSGRNLGPLVIADKYLEQFVLGSDLIRIDIKDTEIRYYVFAFLSTWIGQALLHSNKTGSVIDHLSTTDIGSIKIPIFSDVVTKKVSEIMQKSYELYSCARNELSSCKAQYATMVSSKRESFRLSGGWESSLALIASAGRFDAAFFDPSTAKAANKLLSSGGAVLNTVANVLKPSGRYKTNYVESDYGLPILSGRHLLQEQVV